MPRRKERPLDTVLEIAMPEHWLFRYQSAGPVVRSFAVLIDHAIIMAVLLLLTLLFSIAVIFIPVLAGLDLDGLSLFVYLLGFFVIFWGYFLFFEAVFAGRTPGKMLFGLRVVSIEGTAVSPVQVMIRNLIRIADMFPFLTQAWVFFIPGYGTAMISMFATGPVFRRLGDIAADTVVIREHRDFRKIRPYQPPPLQTRVRQLTACSPLLARAIHEYAVRKDSMSVARREEICQQFEPELRRIFSVDSSISGEQFMLVLDSYLYSTTEELAESGQK